MSATLLTALLFARPAAAQTQFAGWLGTFQNYKLSDRFGIYFDGQFRSSGQWEHMQALLIRPGVNYYITPQLTATVGYAYIPTRKSVGNVHHHLAEHRGWQQLLYTHSVHFSKASRATAVQHRLRLEERFIPKPVVNDEGKMATNGHNYSTRLRYFVRGVIPVTGRPASGDGTGNGGQAKSPAFTQGFFAALQNEVMFNMGDNSVINGKFFDQNRAYLAVGYRFSKQFDTEVGYMNQYIAGAGDNSTNNHILQVATYLRL